MNLIKKVQGFRENLNTGLYRRVWEHSPTLADMLVSDVKMPRMRYSGMSLAGRALAAFLAPAAAYVCMTGCGGSSGGGGNNPTPPIPPPSYACSNSADDDGDTLVDMADPGCNSATDNDEYNAPANNAPVVEAAFNPVVTDEDTPTAVSVLGHFSDPDNDALTYTVQGFTNITAALNGNSIDISAPQDWNGTETGSVRACDTSSACVTTPLEVTFTQVNDKPVVLGVTMYSAIEGAVLDGKVDVTDVDGDAVICPSFNNGGLTELIINPDCTITSLGPVGYERAGNYTATVDAFDGTTTTTSDILIAIANTNRKPVVTDVLIMQAEEDLPLQGYVQRTDADGDATTCELVNSDVTQARVDASGAVYSCTTEPCDSGSPDALPRGVGGNSKTLEVRCTDGFEVSDNFTKNFRIEGYPVLVSLIPNQTTAEDTTIMVDVAPSFSDPNNDTLTYTADCPGTINSSVSGSEVTFSSPANYNGTETCEIQACDLTAMCESDMPSITFTAVDDNPILEEVLITTARELEPLAGQVHATDPDIPYGDTLTYTMIDDPNALGVQVDPSTGAVSTPIPLDSSSSGTYNVLFQVEDSTGRTAQLWKEINVIETNNPPVIDDIVMTISNEGEVLAGQVQYHDDDGDPVTCWKVSSTLSGLLISSDGTISSTAPLPREIAGTFSVTAACTDPHEGTMSSKDFEVFDVMAPGVMTLNAYASGLEGEMARLRWLGSGDDDWTGTPDHFEIRYSASPINNEGDWAGAALLATVTATGPAGTQYDEYILCPAGTWNFALKAIDEAANQSPPSNTEEAAIKTLAEFYVDKWLSSSGFNLNYNESWLVFRGDAGKGIDANADTLAQILINTDDAGGVPFADYANWEDIRDVLLQYTDGQPVTASNSELIDATDSTKLNSFMKYVCEILTYNPGTGNYEYKSQSFNNLTTDEWNEVYYLHKDALVQIVEGYPENYDNLNPNHPPDW